MKEKKHRSYILLTIDVEDWFQVENFKKSIPYHSWSSQEHRVEDNTHRLLNLFDSIASDIFSDGLTIEQKGDDPEPIKATFFILGWLAKRLPHLVREIYSRGHEVASHGCTHELPIHYSPRQYKADLEDSKKLLEDIIGNHIYGYRAPSFAINEEDLKLIQASGYLYDSSYNSFGMHGRYGHLNIFDNDGTIILKKISDSFYELPVSNIQVKHMVLPWGGGGYFRLIPIFIFKQGVKFLLRQSDAYLFYMHPWEIDSGQPRVINAPVFYKFRHYINLSRTYSKLLNFLTHFNQCRFFTCYQYIQKKVKGKI